MPYLDLDCLLYCERHHKRGACAKYTWHVDSEALAVRHWTTRRHGAEERRGALHGHRLSYINRGSRRSVGVVEASQLVYELEKYNRNASSARCQEASLK